MSGSQTRAFVFFVIFSGISVACGFTGPTLVQKPCPHIHSPIYAQPVGCWLKVSLSTCRQEGSEHQGRPGMITVQSPTNERFSDRRTKLLFLHETVNMRGKNTPPYKESYIREVSRIDEIANQYARIDGITINTNTLLGFVHRTDGIIIHANTLPGSVHHEQCTEEKSLQNIE